MNHFYACAIKSLEDHQSYTSAAVKMEGTLAAGLEIMLIYYKKCSTQKLSRVENSNPAGKCLMLEERTG